MARLVIWDAIMTSLQWNCENLCHPLHVNFIQPMLMQRRRMSAMASQIIATPMFAEQPPRNNPKENIKPHKL